MSKPIHNGVFNCFAKTLKEVLQSQNKPLLHHLSAYNVHIFLCNAWKQFEMPTYESYIKIERLSSQEMLQPLA